MHRRCAPRGIDYDGGWAQYTVAREDTLIPIPDTLPFDQAAIIPDAVSTPYAAVVTTAGVRPAQSVGVWGVGGVGAHNVRLARLAGAAPIIAVDPLPSARERALAFGADLALDPAAADFADQVRAATARTRPGLRLRLRRRAAPSASRPPPHSAWRRPRPGRHHPQAARPSPRA